MKNFKNPSGLSLIFSIFTMTIVMVVAGTMWASFMRANARNMDLFRSTQAYYASRASMEKAIAEAATGGIGFEWRSDDEAISWDTNNDGTDDVTGTYEIFSQAKPLDWQSARTTCKDGVECYVPIPGTGNVGTSCDFEDTSAEWNLDPDDDCNWNRIAYGETVTIPLFYTNSSGAIVNSYTTGSETFKLRVRTPIMDTATETRYQLDESEKKVIMSWEFNGTCNDGGDDYSCYLTPITKKGDETFIYNYSINNATSDNFIIIDTLSRSLINTGIDDQKFNIPINKFLTATYYELGYSEHSINQLYFKITLPQSLIAEDGITSIPYLEYQLITNTPIADNKIVYISDGKAMGKLETYVRHMQATQSIENNSIINFVIQN